MDISPIVLCFFALCIGELYCQAVVLGEIEKNHCYQNFNVTLECNTTLIGSSFSLVQPDGCASIISSCRVSGGNPRYDLKVCTPERLVITIIGTTLEEDNGLWRCEYDGSSAVYNVSIDYPYALGELEVLESARAAQLLVCGREDTFVEWIYPTDSGDYEPQTPVNTGAACGGIGQYIQSYTILKEDSGSGNISAMISSGDCPGYDPIPVKSEECDCDPTPYENSLQGDIDKWTDIGIVFIVFFVICLAGNGALGYLYYRERKAGQKYPSNEGGNSGGRVTTERQVNEYDNEVRGQGQRHVQNKDRQLPRPDYDDSTKTGRRNRSTVQTPPTSMSSYET